MKKTNLRRINAKISLVLIVLVFVHLISGSLTMMGIIPTNTLIIQRAIASLFMLLLLCHIIIGFILIFRTQRVKKQTKAPYQKANKLFWNRRDSGIMMIIFLILHLSTFLVEDGAHDISNYFGIVRLLTSLMLIFFVTIHIMTNVRPIFISFGIECTEKRYRIAIIAIAVLAALVTVAFAFYYVRWNVLMDFGGF